MVDTRLTSICQRRRKKDTRQTPFQTLGRTWTQNSNAQNDVREREQQADNQQKGAYIGLNKLICGGNSKRHLSVSESSTGVSIREGREGWVAT